MIHGSRGGDMTIQLDGLSWNSALGNGAAQGYTLNPAEAQEYCLRRGAVAADTMTGGVRANVDPEGGRQPVQRVLLRVVHDRQTCKSDNLTDELKAQACRPPTRSRGSTTTTVSSAARSSRTALWFFGSFRPWGQREQVTGMFRPIDPLSFVFNPDARSSRQRELERPGVYDSWVRSYSLRLTWQVNAKHKLSLYGAHQPSGQFPQAVSATRSYEAASRGSAESDMIQASWKCPVTSRILAETSFASPDNSTPQNEPSTWIADDTISVADTGTGIHLPSVADRYWHQLNHQPSATRVRRPVRDGLARREVRDRHAAGAPSSNANQPDPRG